MELLLRIRKRGVGFDVLGEGGRRVSGGGRIRGLGGGIEY